MWETTRGWEGNNKSDIRGNEYESVNGVELFKDRFQRMGNTVMNPRVPEALDISWPAKWLSTFLERAFFKCYIYWLIEKELVIYFNYCFISIGYLISYLVTRVFFSFRLSLESHCDCQPLHVNKNDVSVILSASHLHGEGKVVPVL
jgi:hypothetical protein